MKCNAAETHNCAAKQRLLLTVALCYDLHSLKGIFCRNEWFPRSCRVTKVREFQRVAKLCEADGHMQQKLKQLLKLSKETLTAACEHAKTAVHVLLSGPKYHLCLLLLPLPPPRPVCAGCKSSVSRPIQQAGVAPQAKKYQVIKDSNQG